MKKIIITFFVILISVSFFETYANEGMCKIQNSSDESIINYIDNNRQVVQKITSQIVWNNNSNSSLWENFKEELNNVRSSATNIYNEAFNFDWYYSNFKYFAVYPISNEVPYPIKRDYDLLEQEWEWLRFLINKITRQWVWNVNLENICEWIGWKCNFWESIRVNDLLWRLVSNNARILDLYRNVVMWEKTENYNDLILVEDNFALKIETTYNQTQSSYCSMEWWFFERIKESIQNIWNLNKEWKDWIKKWQEAVNLMLNKDMSEEEYQDIEKELLKKELSRQWVYWDSQQNMLNSLEKYNKEWGFSLNNNFVYNTFNNTRIKIQKEFQKYRDEVIWDFFSSKPEWEPVIISDVNLAEKNSRVTVQVESRVKNMNEQLKNFESISEYDTDNMRTRIIDLHKEISDSINVLNETCPIAVQVCMKQDPWRWNCWKCN